MLFLFIFNFFRNNNLYGYNLVFLNCYILSLFIKYLFNLFYDSNYTIFPYARSNIEQFYLLIYLIKYFFRVFFDFILYGIFLLQMYLNI